MANFVLDVNLHTSFSEVGSMFQIKSEASKKTISVVNYMKNLLVLIIFTEYAYY